MRDRRRRNIRASRRGPVRAFGLFLFLFFFGAAACGYQSGIRETPSPGGSARDDLTVAVPLFENATFEPILEKRLGEIFKETLLSRGWKIVGDPDAAPLVLTGRIHRYERIPVSLNLQEQAEEYRIRIGLEVRLFDSTEGRNEANLVWKREVEGAADYIARPDPSADRVAQDRAIREAARRMAERTVDFLLEKRPLAPVPGAAAHPQPAAAE